MTPFPSTFLWGASTAGHQIEGGNTRSDMWSMEHLEGSPFIEPSGDACDSYHRYDEDIRLLAEAGLDTYRFSVEWSRIEPEPGHFSRAELDHYLRMVRSCASHGITPVVTLNHFTVPVWFGRDGAWNQAGAPDLFERYVRRVVTHFGAKVSWYITFNEPNAGALLASTGTLPLAAADATDDFAASFAEISAKYARRVGGEPGVATMALPILTPEGIDNVKQSHRQARAAIKELHSGARVGWSVATPDLQAVDGGEEKVATARAFSLEQFWELSKEDDFVGVQTYTREVFGPDGPLKPLSDESKRFQTGWEYYPDALGNSVRRAAAFTGVPVLVTENGMATDDDALRIEYTEHALGGLAAAVADGVEVLGYMHWTLIDNWEWNSGFAMTFGLIAVDRETFARTPKPSLAWLGDTARSGGKNLATATSL